MLIGFCSFVFIFDVTVIAIVFAAGVGLDLNQKHKPHISISACNIKVIFAFKVAYTY